jgi:hypothetical protein
MKVMDRVRLTRAIDIWLFGAFPAGTTGTVVRVYPLPQPDYLPVALVRLNAPPVPDDPWGGLLQVFAGDTSLEVVTTVTQ